LRTLASLYVLADRGVRWYRAADNEWGPVTRLPHADAVKEKVAQTLRLPWAGLG
jgi:hypothetical protein